MSEDRLDQALGEMRAEDVDAATLDAARARVWATLSTTDGVGCVEFRPDFRAYAAGTLTSSRRLLVEDHLSRCPACRNALADLKGERRVIAMPRRSASRWTTWAGLAAAAAILLSVGYAGRGTLDAWMAPGGARATVVSIHGGVYRLAGGPVAAGAAIAEKEVIRTGPGAHAVLRLADGSTVDVNQRTEMYVTAAWSGQAIQLQRGDVIVQAAKQRRGHLRVLTRDSIASVKGTVFAVSAGLGGSVVSVVEGSVAVDQPGTKVLLRPGQQAASNPALMSSVANAVAWSPDAEQYIQLLASFAKIGEQMTQFPNPLRTNSALLSYLPAGAFVYGAIPNPGGNIGLGLAAAEQQALENAAFKAWWTSETGIELRRIVDRVQSVSSMLGDEVVFAVASAGPGQEVPMVMARVQPEKRTGLAAALDGLFADAGESSHPYSLTEDLVVVAGSVSDATWAASHLGQGSSSPFAAAIGARYQRGAGWLIAVDAAPILQMASGDDAPPIEFAAMTGVKYLFLEQRSPAGAEENEVTLTFDESRKGMASWLADGGSGGAAEYLSADVLLAGYVSVRQPAQLFQEFSARREKQEPAFKGELSKLDEKLRGGYLQNLTAAMGTEAAFAFQGFSMTGPTWIIAGLANDPAAIDGSLARLVDTFNAELGAAEQDKRLVLATEMAGAQQWHTLKAAGFPFGLTWTYDRGYMVVASDRTTGERAIATRAGGSALVWSTAFQRQLPASSAMHPAAFAWINAKGALDVVTALSPSPAVSKVLAERDPVLVVFDGTAEQIHAASRTRLAGVIVDAMLLQSLGQPAVAPEAGIIRH